MKRCIGLILFCIILTVFPVTALASEVIETGVCGDNATWTLYEDGSFFIEGTGPTYDFDWYGSSADYPPWIDFANSITSITIDEGITAVGTDCFWDCGTLEEITISDSVTALKDYSIYLCSQLHTVNIGKGLKEIGVYVFDCCDSLSSINIHSDNTNFVSDENSIIFSKDVTCLYRAPTSLSGEYIIPDSVNEIRKHAFMHCENLEGITFHDGITAIGTDAFASCERLKSIVLPSNITRIEDGTFSGCNFSKIFIPESVTFIGPYAFYHCESLSDVYYSGTHDQWSNIDVWRDNDLLTGAEYIHYSCNSVENHWTSQTVDATCTTPGYSSSVCSCGYERNKEESSDPLGHDLVIDAGYSASCTENGLTDGEHCSRCGEITIAQTEIQALGHEWDEGTVEKEPTVDEPGINVFTCTRCGENMTKEIPVLEQSLIRLAGANRCETARWIADELKYILDIDKFDAIIYASGDNYPDALSGSYLANQHNSPILLYRKAQNSDNLEYIEENLSEGGIVYILGGESAIPYDVEQSLENLNIKSIRLSGENRYDTNLKILDAAGYSGGGKIIICSGNNYPDALVASAAGFPILLVNNNLGDITKEQEQFLSELDTTTEYIILGGMPDGIIKKISRYLGGVMLCGINRYETCTAFAAECFSNATEAVLAYGRDYPDALCGGTLAHAVNAPVILIQDNQIGTIREYMDSRSIHNGYVLGGQSRISDHTALQAFGNTSIVCFSPY